MKTADPTRYADINVPSNDVAWDVLAQVGAAVRKGGAQSPLPGLDPKHLYMAGYSQSGVDTAGFAIGLAKHYGTPAGKPMFDGYFPAAQAASATPLKAGTGVLPMFEYPVWPAVGVPVVNLEDQSGIMGFTAELPADIQATLGKKEYANVSSATTRRADSDKKGDQYRLFEVAGMPHAPGAAAAKVPPRRSRSLPSPGARSRSSTVGSRPARSRRARPRVKLDELAKNSKVAVDANGNTLGGVRSPYLDDTLVRYDAQAPGPVTCGLAGHEAPLDAPRWRRRTRASTRT